MKKIAKEKNKLQKRQGYTNANADFLCMHIYIYIYLI